MYVEQQSNQGRMEKTHQNKKSNFAMSKNIFNSIFSSKDKSSSKQHSSLMSTSLVESTSRNEIKSSTNKTEFTEILQNNYCHAHSSSYNNNSNTNAKRPLVENNENKFVKVSGDKIVISMHATRHNNINNNNINDKINSMDHNGNYCNPSLHDSNNINSINPNYTNNINIRNSCNNNDNKMNHATCNNNINNDNTDIFNNVTTNKNNKPTLKHHSSFSNKPQSSRMRKCYSNDIMEFLNRSQQQPQQFQQQQLHQQTVVQDSWRSGSPPKLLPRTKTTGGDGRTTDRLKFWEQQKNNKSLNLPQYLFTHKKSELWSVLTAEIYLHTI
ncbi:hypothetical protein HELRODRAFT_162825 [Helobdella robusta]|uniref:Uncharacterized protein n=1 Tax=Helobdella robusta TaxID=6412 RepID=T1ET81_HELRO|nr:hypothetical protein HELRODRAFT_162825 [Helobdella robusta]ESN99305.1 hypothetical protein HELRODRAFT_162825 [Helobdella robusta]